MSDNKENELQLAIDLALVGDELVIIRIPYPIEFQPGSWLQEGLWEIGRGGMRLV